MRQHYLHLNSSAACQACWRANHRHYARDGLFLQKKEACKTSGLVPRMRRLRGVAGSLTYYLVCDQLAFLFSSYCFALLPVHPRRSSCRIDRRRFRQPRGVLCWLRSSPCCSRYRPNACLYIFIIASTSSSVSYKTGARESRGVCGMEYHILGLFLVVSRD